MTKADQYQGQKPIGKQPAHEVVYLKLREQILFGDLAPGDAVTIQGLTDALDAGMTPVREAIRRLISDGALSFQGNRRVKVPILSADDVTQLIFVRKAVESELAKRATVLIPDLEIDVLTQVDEALDRSISGGDVVGYLRHNYRFHSYLNSFANAPILYDVSERLWLRFGPSLRVMCGRFGTQNFPDRHKDILDALRRRDAEQTAHSMLQDITQGMDQIVTEMARPGE